MEIYNVLLEEAPENHNLHHLIGMCYLNIPGNNDLAMEHYKTALYGLTDNYMQGSYREDKAPPETLFGLARCHHIDHQFEDAIAYYLEYRNRMIDPDFADLEYVNKQIEACERATVLINEPRGVEVANVGPSPTFAGNAYRPVFSGGDSCLIYMSDEPSKHTIFITYLENGGWTNPEPINDQIGSAGDCFINSVSEDGLELYVSMTDNFNSDIYVSLFENGNWTSIEKLNKNINTIYYESHASVSPDGNRLYFTSNRKGGQGALDIYISEKDEKGEWGKATNIGPLINTPYNEESPAIADDNTTLYFSSQGHNTLGGFDVFYTILRSDGTWTVPENLGYPVNSGGDEVNFSPMDSQDNMFVAARLNENNQLVVQYLRFLSDEELLAMTEQEQKDQPEEKPKAKVPPGQMLARGEERVSQGGPSNKDLVINHIMFDYNIVELSAGAKDQVDRLYMIMDQFQDLTIELVGHADAKGSDSYNLALTKKRSNAVGRYLVEKGIDQGRLVLTGAGESEFIAINANPDGSDNPEGRKLNRYVEIRLSNYEGVDIAIEDIFVPAGLRAKMDMEFSVLLDERDDQRSDLPSGIGGSNIEEIQSGDRFIYIVGRFNQRPDAAQLLNRAVDEGFNKARIIEKKELDRLLAGYKPVLPASQKVYTIQIMALKNPKAISHFNNIGQVTRHTCKDGIYRYVIGEYQGIQSAMEALPGINRLGYKDAFIMNVNHYNTIAVTSNER